jgi:hypothetical protein
MKKHQIKSSIIVLLFFGISIFQLKAQTTKVKGKVTDEKYEVTSLFGQRGLGLRFSAKFDF